MAVTAVAPWFMPVFLDNSGNPLASGTIDTYVAGSSTPQAVYSDENLSVPISNPIVLNSAGRPQASAADTTEVNLYLSAASYKFVVKNSSGTTIRTADNIEAVAGIVYVNNAIASQTSPTITTPTLVSPNITTSITYPSAAPIGHGVCGGRLTLTSGTAVTTSDVTGATTVYFTPYDPFGAFTGAIGLFNGTNSWTVLPFTEISVALGTLTSGLPYDIFAYNNSGVVALRSPVAWTNTTTRATALTTQNGILVKTGATTDRYLGTFMTTSTTQTEDSAAKRFLWNYYNRVPRSLSVLEATATWAGGGTANVFRQVRATATNQVSVVVGVAEVTVSLTAILQALNATTNDTGFTTAIGYDSTSAAATGCIYMQDAQGVASANYVVPFSASLTHYPAVGSHNYVWLELQTDATPAQTTFSGAQTGRQSGMTGWTQA